LLDSYYLRLPFPTDAGDACIAADRDGGTHIASRMGAADLCREIKHAEVNLPMRLLRDDMLTNDAGEGESLTECSR